MWPFRKPEPETRAESYTDAVVEALVRSATGVDANPIQTAAVAAASGLWGRCFAMADVSPSPERTGLSGDVLADIGRAFVEGGESVWLIEVRGGQVTLTRATDHDVTGNGPDESGWRYRLSLGGPSGIRQVTVPASQVFHPRINADPAQPHRGRSPVALAGAGGKLSANLESSLANETGAPSGYVLPAPMSAIGDKPLADLTASLKTLKGRFALAESMGGAWKGSAAGAPPADWKQQRVGSNPPETLIKLSEDAGQRVLAACGIPPSMFAVGGDAAGARESFRQFVFSTAMPIAKVMEREASVKLGTAVQFDFAALGAADLQGRARSLKAMVDAGMPLDDARRLAGLV